MLHHVDPKGYKPEGIQFGVFKSYPEKHRTGGNTKSQRMQEFLDSCGQFERILKDSGFVKLERLNNDDLTGTNRRPYIS
jgi:hypothetical protein